MATKENRPNNKLESIKKRNPDWNWDYWIHQLEV